ncbi:hypothetical protein ACFQV2_00215 [Actinokineospora soli]
MNHTDMAKAVTRLAVVVDRVANAVADHVEQPCCPTTAPASWLTLPADPELARTTLTALCAWTRQVYLRYSDAAAGLPDCWLWHPDVIEELHWLHQAWQAAYHGPTASPVAAGEWHERHRPGVVRRVKAVAGTCSRENHQTRRRLSAAPVEQLDEAADLIAAWWAADREQPAPEPRDELAVAHEHPRSTP